MDQWRQLKPGEEIPGLPSDPWNKFLDKLKGRPLKERPAGLGPTSVEFDVLNSTPNDLDQFSILGVNEPFVKLADDEGRFLNDDDLKGIAPSPDRPFVVIQNAVIAGEFVRGRILGLTRVRVRMNNAGDLFAGPGTSTDYLESAASGPVQIIWVDETCGGSGSGGEIVGSGSGAGIVCWAAVLIGGGSAGAGGRVEPGQPLNDGAIPPFPFMESWSRLRADPSVPSVTAVEAIWFWDLNHPQSP